MTPGPLTVSERDLMGPFSRVVIAMLPDSYRDTIVGDLIEEASTIIAPASGAVAARRWLRGQFLRSVPALISIHFKQKESDEMRHAKWLAATAVAMMGAIQAWDSGILAAPPVIGVMVVLAIAVGIAGIFLEHDGLRFGIALFVLALLGAARILSPVRLPELGLVGLPVFLVLVLGPRFLALRKERGKTGGPQAPA